MAWDELNVVSAAFQICKTTFPLQVMFLYNCFCHRFQNENFRSQATLLLSWITNILPSFSWKASLTNSLAVGLSARSTGIRSAAGLMLFSCLSIKTDRSNVNSPTKKNLLLQSNLYITDTPQSGHLYKTDSKPRNRTERFPGQTLIRKSL